MSANETIPQSVPPFWNDYSDYGVSPDHATARMLSGMTEDVRYSFTPSQLAAFIEANKPRIANHWVDYKVSIPWIGKGFYIRLFVGKERRNRSRLNAEGQVSLPKTSIALVFFLWAACCLAMFGCVILLYLIKSFIGIDLFSGPSLFHPFFFQ